jgi:hypothetical protein
MTAQRRLAKLEETLSPTQHVLRWLAEAHAYGDIEPYVASLLSGDPPLAPLDRLAREAVQGTRTAMRGKRPEVVAAAVRSALRETVFRFELVMCINVTAHELLDRESLIDAALSANLCLAFGRDQQDPLGDQRRLEHLATLRDLICVRVDELLASGEARRLVQERYLDGHTALFPAVAAAWEEQIHSTQVIAAMAVRMAELDGARAAPAPDPETLSRRTTELIADLVEPAKSETLDKLGEGARSLGVAAGWVRTKLHAGIHSDGGPGSREASGPTTLRA